MKKIAILLFFIICNSCKESKNIKIESINGKLNSELYNTILAYQTDVKIPKIRNTENSKGVKNIESALIYVYEVKFIIEGKDTIASITLRSGGINQYYDSQIPINEKIYGIYQDENLKATYVNDPQKVGNYFIKEYIQDQNILSKFFQKNDFINDDIYDVYIYKVREEKLVFNKILKGNKR